MIIKKLGYLISLVGGLCLFSSCIKYHKVIKSEFPQGNENQDCREITHNNVRSQKIYNEFKTEALFDVLLLSDQTRTAYVKNFAQRRGKNQEGYQQLLDREFEENKHWVSFYVLAEIRDNSNPSLNEENSYWTLSLQTPSGNRIEPTSIEEVDIEPEYQTFFNHRFTAHKTVYLVKFPQQDLDNKNLINPNDPITLVIASPTKELPLVWDRKDYKKHAELLSDKDFYWC
ncbi:hypothetical protein K2X40_02630 [Candidatus Babeliales bacterium]|nr:hypothetical protein [Candidatus Babeliales bacterium]